MTLNIYKSIIYNRRSKMDDDGSIEYEKIFLYDKVEKKLFHNLTVMPKDRIDGKIFIWKFENGEKPSLLSMSMEEYYPEWKHEYNAFVDKFNADAFVYYIKTLDKARNKVYRTIIVLIPKKESFDESVKLLDEIDIEAFVKKAFVEKLEEKEGKIKESKSK